MALSTAEIQQCKFYLGYGNLLVTALPYFDIAIVFEDVVQRSLDTAWAETYVRGTILANLLQLDIDIMTCRTRFQAAELVGDVKLNPEEFNQLVGLKDYWIKELSKSLKVPIAPDMNGSGSCGPMEMW